MLLSKGLKVSIILNTVLVNIVLCQEPLTNEIYPQNPILPPPRQPPPPDIIKTTSIDNRIDRWDGFMNTAKSFVASPAGQLAVTMAKEMISRSAGGGQILSLNFQSLLAVVLLKALVLIAGMLGVGQYNGQYARGRVLQEGELLCLELFEFSMLTQCVAFLFHSSKDSFISQAEMQLYTGFLAAEGSNYDGCLYRAVCVAPELGNEYMKAGIALLDGLSSFDK